MDDLTQEQARFAQVQVLRWLDIKRKNGQDVWPPDATHSALLYRLLRGREPLPKPPPLEYSYPVYPDWPY